MSATVRVELRVLGERVAVEVPRPADRSRLDEVLPLLRAIDDRAVELAVREVEGKGETVACRRGCSACCRAQPVPVTPAEAHALSRLVESLPDPRRAEVRARFADRVARMRAAGLDSHFLERDTSLTLEQARAIAGRYFALGLVCPFLEVDACGIYPDRPFVCRQYLVTSPAELCADPFANAVQVVPMPVHAAGASMRAAEEVTGRPQYSVPLVLALEYAAAHRDELEATHPSAELFQASVVALARRPEDDAAETNP
jgi:Fe-S-cluster containining protein